MNCPFHEWAGTKRLNLRLAHVLIATLGPSRMAGIVFSSMVSPGVRAASLIRAFVDALPSPRSQRP